MRYLSYLILSASLLAVSCNNESNTGTNSSAEATVTAPPAAPHSKLDEAGTQKLMDLVNSYYSLKNALVATNGTQADEAATQLKSAADSMKTRLTGDAANGPSFQPYLDSIAWNSDQIAAQPHDSVEVKRAYFEKASDALFTLLKQAELKNAGIYRQYCPMAFNDKGAYWLSNEASIKNPYFGKKMLSCGEVRDSLK